MIVDKYNLLPGLSEAVLELGCGTLKRVPGSIGIDLEDLPSVDVVGDVLEVLPSLAAASVRLAHSSHFLEHLADLPTFMTELARVVRPGGRVEIIVPHFSNPYYYSDPTHKTFFGLYTFCYLAKCELFRREVSGYNLTPAFAVEDIKLRFMSPRPFIVRHAAKRAFQIIVNQTRWLQEFFEENLSHIYPCYDMHISLVRIGATVCPM